MASSRDAQLNIIALEEDQYQGRWRILCDSGSCKSLGAGGLPHACDLVLHHSWSMHTPHTGEAPPFDNIEELHWACIGFEPWLLLGFEPFVSALEPRGLCGF